MVPTTAASRRTRLVTRLAAAGGAGGGAGTGAGSAGATGATGATAGATGASGSLGAVTGASGGGASGLEGSGRGGAGGDAVSLIADRIADFGRPDRPCRRGTPRTGRDLRRCTAWGRHGAGGCSAPTAHCCPSSG